MQRTILKMLKSNDQESDLPTNRTNSRQFCTEQCGGDCNRTLNSATFKIFANLCEFIQENHFNSTHRFNEYFERSFSPSMVVMRSIICPAVVWNSTCNKLGKRSRALSTWLLK